MKTFLNTRLLIPVIIIIAGIYFISHPDTPQEKKTFWKFLTGFALLVGAVRAWMLYKQKEKDTEKP